MSEKTEVEELIKNIHQGLKKVGLKELNSGILRLLSGKNDKSVEIDYVLQLVCKEYSLSIHSLKTKYPKGIVQDAKQVAYCLLHFNLNPFPPPPPTNHTLSAIRVTSTPRVVPLPPYSQAVQQFFLSITLILYII